jgi:hypothetical protein
MSLTLLTLLLAYTPAEATALFNEANAAYAADQFDTACEKYERLIAAGHTGPNVLFNLGTAHLAAGRLGPAVLALIRAQRLSRDDDIDAQLAVALKRQGDQVEGVQEASPFFERVARAINERWVSFAFLASWWLAFVLGFLFVRAPTSRKLILGFAAATVLAFALSLGVLVGVHAWVTQSVVEAVVIPPTVQVREFPTDTAKVAFEVHAGLLVRVMEDTGQFVRIRLPNALEGWVDKSQIIAL